MRNERRAITNVTDTAERVVLLKFSYDYDSAKTPQEVIKAD